MSEHIQTTGMIPEKRSLNGNPGYRGAEKANGVLTGNLASSIGGYELMRCGGCVNMYEQLASYHSPFQLGMERSREE